MKNVNKYLSSPEFLIMFVILTSTIFLNILFSIIYSNSKEYYDVYSTCYRSFDGYYCEDKK